MRWVPDIGRHRTVAEVQTALLRLNQSIRHGDCQVFGVWNRATSSYLGEVGVYSIDQAADIGEVGFWLRQSAQGSGYAQEGVTLLLNYANQSIGLKRFEAHIASDNEASLRVAERLGFLLAGRRQPAPRWDGNVEDVLIYTGSYHAR